MVRFCGQDSCLIDANGRLKLSPRFLDDFREFGDTTVLRSLPEGALGVYPEAIWHQMRQREADAAVKAGVSAAYRRQLRSFNAMSDVQDISKQGRLTIPVLFRERLGLLPGSSVVVVGVDMGVEIWETVRWEKEVELLDQHEAQMAMVDMAAAVAAAGRGSSPDSGHADR
jgi:DNA-binding transcriptional regulator/RsmH inhibitor MraZ